MKNKHKGVTLVELMIILVIAGITLSAAIPSFQGMIARNRIASQVNEFLIAVNLARSEALRVGGTVSVQAIDGSDSDDEFGEGWCVVVGNPGNCTNAVRMFEALEGTSSLNSVEDVTSLQFNSLGGLTNTAGATRNFDLCHPTEDGRRVAISLVGRAKSHKPDDPDATKQPGC